mmetsp:Transcript_12891/g.34730  ORF Transcript_12891/g.34730 Transcript_12891/m.34730 type:complete len:215 (-) Transcript_12891:50-694(-)
MCMQMHLRAIEAHGHVHFHVREMCLHKDLRFVGLVAGRHGVFVRLELDLSVDLTVSLPLSADALLELEVARSLRPHHEPMLARLPPLHNQPGYVVALLFRHVVTNQHEHRSEPLFVQARAVRHLERDGPLPPILIRRVFPLRFDSLFKQLVRAVDRKLGRLQQVVEQRPEVLHGVESAQRFHVLAVGLHRLLRVAWSGPVVPQHPRKLQRVRPR